MAFGDILKQLDKDGDGFELSDLKNIGSLDFGQIVNGDFLQKFTKFGSVQDLLAKLGLNKPEDLAKADPAKLDSAVKENSSFGNWQELLSAAKDHLLKK